MVEAGSIMPICKMARSCMAEGQQVSNWVVFLHAIVDKQGFNVACSLCNLLAAVSCAHTVTMPCCDNGFACYDLPAACSQLSTMFVLTWQTMFGYHCAHLGLLESDDA